MHSIQGSHTMSTKEIVPVIDLRHEPRHNSLDPVELILTLALRTGAVNTAGINQLISSVLAHADRTIKRSHLNWLLHQMFHGAGSSLEPHQPAHVHQFTRALQSVATTTGIDLYLVFTLDGTAKYARNL
jgi:hypothetical protein